jgi:hypothetical protein
MRLEQAEAAAAAAAWALGFVARRAWREQRLADREVTKTAQGRPKSWAKLRPLIGILGQNAGQVTQFGPTLCISR